MSPSEAYSVIEDFAQRNLILLDWGETILETLVVLDEAKAWPSIKKMASDNDIRSSFRVKGFIGSLKLKHQSEFIGIWLGQEVDNYALPNMLESILRAKLDNSTQLSFLKKLKSKVDMRGSFRDSYLLLRRIKSAMEERESLTQV